MPSYSRAIRKLAHSEGRIVPNIPGACEKWEFWDLGGYKVLVLMGLASGF